MKIIKTTCFVRAVAIMIVSPSLVSCGGMGLKSHLDRQKQFEKREHYISKTEEVLYDPPYFGISCIENSYTNRLTFKMVAGPYKDKLDCESSPELGRERKSLEDHFAAILKKPPYSRYKKQIADKEVSIGMPREVVLLILGEPSDINRTTSQHGVYEQLVYPGKYIYISGGKVTTIQD